MSNKTTFLGSSLTVGLLLLVFMLVNALAARYHVRFDLTEDQRYTLADGLQSILADLGESDEVVEIVLYLTNEVPGHAVSARDRLLDMAADIEAVAGTSIELSYVDPQDSDALADEAAEYGIQQVQMIAPSGSQTMVAKIYAGIVCKRGGRFETVPQLLIQGRQGGVIVHPEAEYEIAAALLKVGSDDRPKLGYLTGHQEPPLGPEDRGVHQALAKVYQVQEVDTSAMGAVPEDLDLLIVRSPQMLDDRDRYAIDQFVMSGKPVVFLTPRSGISDTGQLAPTDAMLLEMLQHYGADVTPELLVAPVMFGPAQLVDQTTGQPILQAMMPIAADALDEEHPATARLGALQTVLAGPVLPTDNLGGRSFRALVSVPQDAAAVGGLQDVDLRANARVKPGIQEKPVADEAALLAVIEGPQTSYWKDKDIPDPRAPQPQAPPPPPEKPVVNEVANAKIIVASFDFMMFNRVVQNPTNVELMLNLFDNLVLGESLISIRSRLIESRPLTLLSEEEEKKIETEVVARYTKLDPEFKLNPTMGDLIAWQQAEQQPDGESAEERMRRVRKAQVEISDETNEAIQGQKRFHYLLNFALMPFLFIVGGILRWISRKAKSGRTFTPKTSASTEG